MLTHFRSWWRWSFFPRIYSQQMLRYNTTCWTNYRFSSRFGEDSKAGMKLRTFSSGWGGWLGLLSGTSLGCNWFIYRMRNTWINLLEKKPMLAVVQIQGERNTNVQRSETLMCIPWQLWKVHPGPRTTWGEHEQQTWCPAWWKRLWADSSNCWSSIHDVIWQRKMQGYNKNKLSKTLTWTRVPRAMAFDASWMRSAACKPKMWTPRISPVSDR